MELLEIAKLPTAENSAIHLNPLGQRRRGARAAVAGRRELRIDGVAVDGARRRARRPQDRASRASSRAKSCTATGRSIGRAKQAIEPGHHVHTHNVAFEELTFDYEFPDRRDSLPRAAEEHADVSRLSARGRPRGHAQLHRGGGGQQLRGAHRRADRRKLRRRNAAAERRWRGGISARRRLRPHDRPRYRAAAAHAGRRAGASQCVGRGHSGPGLRGEPDRSLPGAERAAPARAWSA